MTSLFSLFFFSCLGLKHFPGWDTSFLNEVMSIKDALAHQPQFFQSFFFFFFPTGWWLKHTRMGKMGRRYFFSLSQTRGNAWELPVGPKRSWQAPCQGKRAAVKTLTLTNKDRGSSGLKGKIRSLIPLSSILHGFHWVLTDRASYKDSIETSSLLW